MSDYAPRKQLTPRYTVVTHDGNGRNRTAKEIAATYGESPDAVELREAHGRMAAKGRT